MIIFKAADQISEFISEQKQKGKCIGFVPTMGALHAGHLSLIAASKSKNDVTVCSIFVNPTQFNNPDDFKRYPITVEKDIQVLVEAGCNVLFLPPVSEIYPPQYQKKTYNLGQIENTLEGFYRPGHFQGVCQVVDRLLEIVDPHKIYLGQKDYQQCMVVQKLIEIIGKEDDYKLITVPTMRESDGLAMSSRNLRLSETDRKKAPTIYQTLKDLKENYTKNTIDHLTNKAAERLKANEFKVDYVAVVDAKTLEPAKADTKQLVALVAASISDIRLIDNLPLN